MRFYTGFKKRLEYINTICSIQCLKKAKWRIQYLQRSVVLQNGRINTTCTLCTMLYTILFVCFILLYYTWSRHYIPSHFTGNSGWFSLWFSCVYYLKIFQTTFHIGSAKLLHNNIEMLRPPLLAEMFLLWVSTTSSSSTLRKSLWYIPLALCDLCL